RRRRRPLRGRYAQQPNHEGGPPMKRAMFVVPFVVTLPACTDDKPCDPDAPNTICTIAGHTLDFAYAGDHGPATEADIELPMDSGVAHDGTVWFIDFNSYVIRRIDHQGVVETMIGNHLLGDSPASDGLPSIAALDAANNHTPSMTFANGYLYLPA